METPDSVPGCCQNLQQNFLLMADLHLPFIVYNLKANE